MKRDLYLYIHFPFCIKKCSYCNFYSFTELDAIGDYFQYLYREIDLYYKILTKYPIKTIYLGGGSPNLIPATYLEELIRHIKKYNDLTALEEFTVEINPSNISAEKLSHFLELGVNRISMGAQSFFDSELEFLDRVHTRADIFRTVENLHQVGIQNFSLDLIYGIPSQTATSWEENLSIALKTGATHFSFYNLIYEPGTPLTAALARKQFQPVDEDREFEMFRMAHDKLARHNYFHYEISNWAIPGKESVHNSAYWQNKNYLGLGPAAHSFMNDDRWYNFNSFDSYRENLDNIKFPIQYRETIDSQLAIQELVMLGLRKAQGMSIRQFINLTNLDIELVCQKMEQIFDNRFLKKYAQMNNDFLQLTVEGWFICDYIVKKIIEITEEIRDDNKKTL
ncbi:MAG: radical SAM family heme chaperone HemW [Fidelibacterota bacterium]